MSDEVAVASAVSLPTRELSPPRPKRRYSSGPASPESSKRLRLDRDDAPEAPSATEPAPGDASAFPTTLKTPEEAAPSEPRRRARGNGVEEEKKRGKRLFGALLGQIGKFKQDSASARQRTSAVKRREAEEKMKEKLARQTQELDAKKRMESDAERKRRRDREREFDGKTMKLRHQNMAAQANVLSTSRTPKLFYLPWKLLPSEESTIKAQVEKVGAQIVNEEAEYERRCAAETAEDAELEGAPPGTANEGANLEEGQPPPTQAAETVANEENAPANHDKPKEDVEAEDGGMNPTSGSRHEEEEVQAGEDEDAVIY